MIEIDVNWYLKQIAQPPADPTEEAAILKLIGERLPAALKGQPDEAASECAARSVVLQAIGEVLKLEAAVAPLLMGLELSELGARAAGEVFTLWVRVPLRTNAERS